MAPGTAWSLRDVFMIPSGCLHDHFVPEAHRMSGFVFAMAQRWGGSFVSAGWLQAMLQCDGVLHAPERIARRLRQRVLEK